VQMQTREGVAEIVVDRRLYDSASTEANFGSATVQVIRSGFGTQGFACPAQSPPVGSGQGTDFCEATATWADVDFDTTQTDALQPADYGPNSPAPITSCPSPAVPCFNGPLVAIDKARDYYVMQRGGSRGGHAYVVYAVGGGGEPYSTDAPGANPAPRPPAASAQVFNGERPSGAADEYFIDGLRAPAEPTDDFRCGYFARVVQAGCARFDAAMTFDDRMVYEYAGTAPRRTQTHFLTNGEAPIGD
ncbi:MAG TPA: hypothetical protein VMY88_07450, partial [Acidimicrobiales bacterium]|nr:hypothetical protein [Acidimicrobiales bacterium]